MIEVKKYKNTGLDYIQGTEKILFRIDSQPAIGGVLALVSEFKDWDVKGKVLAQVMEAARDPSRVGYDFDHLIETGQLSRLKKKSPMPKELTPVPEAQTPLGKPVTVEIEDVPQEIVDETKAEDIQIEDAIEEKQKEEIEVDVEVDVTVHETEKVSVIHKAHNSPTIIIAVMGLIGLGSLIMSGYHIYLAMVMAREVWVSVVTGVMMSLFSAIAFTTGRQFWSIGGPSGKSVAAMFWFFGSVTTLFAMLSTMTVQYDAFKNMSHERVTAVVQTSNVTKLNEQYVSDLRSAMSNVASEINDAKRTANVYLGEVKRLNELINNGSSDPKQVHSWIVQRENQQWLYTVAERKLKPLQEQYNSYQSKLLSTPASTEASIAKQTQEAQDDTVYGMLSRMFHISKDTLSFIMYVSPAVFYDLMSPFAITVVLILDERRGRKSKIIAKGGQNGSK